MHCTGSSLGTMVHSLVAMWQLVFIVFCFHMLLMFVYSWEALFGEWAWSWRCPLGVWFSPFHMLYVLGETMGTPWFPHHSFSLHVGEVIGRRCIVGRGTTCLIQFVGRLGPILEAMTFQPNISNPLTLIINGVRNHLDGKIWTLHSTPNIV